MVVGSHLRLRARAQASVRVDYFTLVAAVGVFIVLSWISVGRHNGYLTTMFDLGNMAQPIWSVTQGRPLEVTSESGNISRLSVHVEIIYFALAPLYAMWPDPRTLLVAQAVVVALGVIPAYRLGRRHTGSLWGARALALGYLFAPAMQSAVVFDLHGDTLAMPLLLFAIDALEQRHYRAYFAWLALALPCKVYVAVPVAALGFVLLWRRETRRVGLLTMVAGSAYFLLVFVGVRRLFSPEDTHASVGTVSGYTRFYFSWGRGFENVVTRIFSAVILLQPLLGLTWRVMWRLIPGLAVAVPALLGVGSLTYSIRSHHFALAEPFVLWTLAAGAGMLARRVNGQVRLRLWSSISLPLMAAFSLALLNVEWSRILEIAQPVDWVTLKGERAMLQDRWLEEHIPPLAPVAGSQPLIVHLTERSTLFTLLPPHSPDPLEQMARNLEHVEYVVANAYDSDEQLAIGQLMGDTRFDLVDTIDGLVLFRTRAHGARSLQPWWERAKTEGATAGAATFGGLVALNEARIEPLGGGRYRASYEWQALAPLNRERFLFAATEVVGVPHARYVHLTLLPSLIEGWRAGDVIRESWEVELPEETPAGTYPIRVGWYEVVGDVVERVEVVETRPLSEIEVAGERR